MCICTDVFGLSIITVNFFDCVGVGVSVYLQWEEMGSVVLQGLLMRYNIM